MKKLKKIDLVLALAIGETAAMMLALVGRNLSKENPALNAIMPYAGYLFVFFPIFCLAVLLAAYYLKKIFRRSSFFQFGKFCLVGGFNFLLDATILNLLIFATGIAAGLGQSGFKGLAFIVTVMSSYVWNKNWTFGRGGNKTNSEILVFFMVSGVGFSINVGVDYFLVNAVARFWGMKPILWAQFSAVLAAASGLAWNFIGYKFIVFKKEPAVVLPENENEESAENLSGVKV